jgi:hypothetical protein
VDVLALAGGGYSVDGIAMTVDEVGNGVRNEVGDGVRVQ